MWMHLRKLNVPITFSSGTRCSYIHVYGQLAKLATKLEIKDHKWAATTDHWTPPGSGVTYTCNTFHAIIGWRKVNILQDFSRFLKGAPPETVSSITKTRDGI